MKIDSYKCDVCGTMKGENNHWFRIDAGPSGLELNAWGVVPATATSADLCSDGCVMKMVGKWLTEQATVSGARQAESRGASVLAINAQRAG